MNLRSRQEFLYNPPRRAGQLFHAGLIIFLLGAGAFGLFQASQAQIGLAFLLYLLPALVAFFLTPLLGYQLYALTTSFYILERDGIRLRWGLRIEEIPMSEVLWVQSQDDLTIALPFPPLRLPGSVVGIRQLEKITRPAEPKLIEYLASNWRDMVLIGTPERVYAISPTDPGDFIYTYERLIELGSLTPLARRSIFPTFLIAQVWASLPARILTLSSLILSLILLVWISLAIPSRSEIHLGFQAAGNPGDLVPAIQLLLLPALNGLIVLFDLVLGLFFFRRQETQVFSLILWASSTIVPLLFIIAAFFILRTA